MPTHLLASGKLATPKLATSLLASAKFATSLLASAKLAPGRAGTGRARSWGELWLGLWVFGGA